MSLSRGCMLLEVEPGVWHAVVATDEYDYDFNSCEAYGPRGTSAEAWELMSQHTSNPGSSETIPHDQVTAAERDIFSRAFKWIGDNRSVRSGGLRRAGPFTWGF